MKILYVSNYRNSSGYSTAAQGYILALHAANLDVVPRHFNLLPQQSEIPPTITELEKKSELGCNINIQHTLPDFMSYDGRFDKNIAIFAWETNKIPPKWVRKLNIMDEIWVVNSSMPHVCMTSGIRKPLYVVPHAFDIDKYNAKYNIYKPLQFLVDQDKFLFYTIGEFTKRKNFAALLKAFHTEFLPYEPVELIIKTNKSGLSSPDCFNQVAQYCKELKEALRIYSDLSKYKQEYIITDYLEEKYIYELHNTCHCFVSASYGEAWNCGLFDAMGFGKTPIASNTTSHQDFIPGELRISVQQDVCFGNMESPEGLYDASSEWDHVDIPELKRKMREMYEGWKKQTEDYKNMVNLCKERVYDYSYHEIGSLISNILNGTHLQKSY